MARPTPGYAFNISPGICRTTSNSPSGSSSSPSKAPRSGEPLPPPPPSSALVTPEPTRSPALPSASSATFPTIVEMPTARTRSAAATSRTYRRERELYPESVHGTFAARRRGDRPQARRRGTHKPRRPARAGGDQRPAGWYVAGGAFSSALGHLSQEQAFLDPLIASDPDNDMYRLDVAEAAFWTTVYRAGLTLPSCAALWISSTNALP